MNNVLIIILFKLKMKKNIMIFYNFVMFNNFGLIFINDRRNIFLIIEKIKNILSKKKIIKQILLA